MTERSPAEILVEIAAARTEAWGDFWKRVYVTTPTGRQPSEPEMQEITSRGVPIMIVDYETDGLDLSIGPHLIPMDFAETETRVLAIMGSPPCQSFTMTPRDEQPQWVTWLKEIKQEMAEVTGVSAAMMPKPYLRHDPTKNHRKVRKCDRR